MKILVLILFVIYNNKVETKGIPIKNSDTACIARYLINNHIIRDSDVKGKIVESSSSSSSSSDDDNCDERIHLANNEFYRQLSKKSSGNKRVDSCIMSTLRQHNSTNIIFKEILMFHINDRKESRVMRDLKTIKERLFSTAELICHHQDIFAPNINEKFDNLADNNVDINDIYEFNEIKHCLKEQIVKNGVVDVMKSRIDISPRNIEAEDLEELDCKEVVDDLYNTMNRDIEEILSVSPVARYVKTSCVVAKGEEFKFLEKMFSYVFLIHSNMSREQKSLVRRKADETEPSVARYTLECVNLY